MFSGRSTTGGKPPCWRPARTLPRRLPMSVKSVPLWEDIVRTLRAKGATLKATEQPINTSSAAGKAFLDMLGVFAEFETNLRRERQLEGIAAANAKGVYKGRPSTIDAEAIKRLRDEGMGPAIAKRLGIGRASVIGSCPSGRFVNGKPGKWTTPKGPKRSFAISPAVSNGLLGL